jgi:hypothetical protein
VRASASTRTAAGANLGNSRHWTDVDDRSRAIAEASANMTGNALKDRIYERLADLMDRPHRQVIR